jgi:predicted nucleotidyltransferase
MRETTSFVTSLASAVEAVAAPVDGIVSVWLFGSAVSSSRPSDVDLLVIYRPAELAPVEASNLRAVLESAVERVSDLDADVVVLSESEAFEVDFVRRERAQCLYVRDAKR